MESTEQLSIDYKANIDRIFEDFSRFHANNPGVYAAMVLKSREIKRAGWNVYGIGAITEAARYHCDLNNPPPLDGSPHEFFKINNNYRALYARLIMEQESDLAGFFRLRIRPSEN